LQPIQSGLVTVDALQSQEQVADFGALVFGGARVAQRLQHTQQLGAGKVQRRPGEETLGIL